MDQDNRVKRRGRFSSTKTKVMLSTLIPVIVSFSLIMIITFTNFDVFAKDTAEKKFLQTSQKHAFGFERKLNDALNYLSILSTFIDRQTALGGMDRQVFQNTVLNIVRNYGLIDGSSVYFEPNQFDGRDEYYKGTDFGSTSSGRISWYFYKVNDKIMFLPEAMDNDIEFDLPHYAMAKEANAPIFTDPFTYEIEGVDIHMFTLTYPLNSSAGEFIGAVTVDVFLNDLFEVLNNEKVYDTGYVGIVNNRGVIIYSPIYEYIGLTLGETGSDFDLSEFENGTGSLNGRSIINGKESLIIVYPAYIPQLDATFYVYVSAPLDEIYAESRATTLQLFLFCVLVVALIALLVYILIRRIINPIHYIADSIDRISNGEYHARIEGNFDGEIAIMTESVNRMAERIEANIKDLQIARESAEKGNRVKSDFLSRMSHEMRTPLNAIIGMTSIAKNSTSEEQQQQCNAKIKDASNHLLGIINDILDMSKIEVDEFTLNYNDFNFRNMLDRVLVTAKYSIDKKNHELTVSVDDSIPETLAGDELRLAQVISNVLSNAVKFSPEKTRIEIIAKLLEEKDGLYTMQIEVSDEGIGMTETQLESIFRPFEQIDGSDTRKYGGIGIGLVISKRIVEMMGGGIWAVSEHGKGSTFVFTFTMKKGFEAGPALLDTDKGDTTNRKEERPNYEGKTALLADDIEINREIIMAILEETGMAFDCAENGREAVELFAANPGKYDIIFMDIQMPEVDGYEATMTIRFMDVPEAVTIPIIALTANVFREDVIKCLDSGMNNHVGKPIDSDELFEKMKIYLPGN